MKKTRRKKEREKETKNRQMGSEKWSKWKIQTVEKQTNGMKKREKFSGRKRKMMNEKEDQKKQRR